MKTLTISNKRSNEHSKSVELQGKEIKILTSHCVQLLSLLMQDSSHLICI